MAAALLALTVMVWVWRPPLPSALLYRDRPVERAGAEALHDDLARTPVDAPPADVLTDPLHLRMTTGEYRRIVADVKAQTAVELDRVEDQLRAGLEWLEASVAVWLDTDPEVAHATAVMHDYEWSLT